MADNSRDKLFEALAKEAFERYADDIINEPLSPLDEKTEAEFDKNRQRVYGNVMKLVKKRQRRSRPRSWKKLWLLVAVLAVAGCVTAINATAFKAFLFKSLTSVEGDVLNMSADYAGFDAKYAEITNFDNKEELIVPGWLPDGAELVKVQDEYKNVRLKYLIDEDYLEIHEISIGFAQNNTSVFMSGNIYKTEDINVLGMNGEIASVKYEDGLEKRTAVFCSDTTKFVINSTLSETKLLFVLEKLKYFQKN